VGNLVGPNTNPVETFGQWVTRMLQNAKASQGKLARTLATREMVALRRRGRDERIKGRGIPQKPDVGKICAGTLPAGPVVAYRYGAALERMGAPCSGLDALIVAQRWSEAIGCIGEYIRAYDPGSDYNPNTGMIEEDPDELSVLADVYANRLHGAALPKAMHPAMEQAWIEWLTHQDAGRLHPRIGAAYLLAASPYEKEHAYAMQILSEWAPLGRLVLDRNPKRA
jgi:hypothetical protein